MDQSIKDEIFNIIVENKMKIFNRRNKEDNFRKFLIKKGINFQFEITISNVIKYLKNIDDKCFIQNCNNKRKFIGFRTTRTEFGFQKYCSKECEYLSISIRQSGKNNTCHRMNRETFQSMCNKNSKNMKNKICSGEFTPCITNSWTGSKSELYLNGQNFKYRSSWEAFFHLCNPNLKYEFIRIPYFYKNKSHIYIVDFVDLENKIIYEIKPEKCLLNDRVVVKNQFASVWCRENGFNFKTITDEWFKANFSKNKQLLLGQMFGESILKKLNQFNED